MSSTVIVVPRDELRARIEADGWVQASWGEGVDGPACLHGHIRRCDMRPGDAFVLERVYARREVGSVSWNDRASTTVDDVLEFVSDADLDVSDVELELTFGPQWLPVVDLVRRAAVLTADEAEQLHAARGAARGAARDAARGAAQVAAEVAARGAAQVAARDAASGLVVADLVGQHGLRQEHVDTLLVPWVSVCGDPRGVVADV